MSHTSAKDMNDYFQDKRMLTTYIQSFKSGEKIDNDLVYALIETENRWKKYTPLYRSVRDDFGVLKTLFIQKLQRETSEERKEKRDEERKEERKEERGEGKKEENQKNKTTKQGEERKQREQPKQIGEIKEEDRESSRISSYDNNLQQKKRIIEEQEELISLQKQVHPSSALIHSFYDSQGLVGEYENRELLVYGALSRTNIGIESIAGSGKSALLYAFLKAIPEEEYFTIHQSTAKAFYNNPAINNAHIWVIPELQKIFSQDVEEIIKNLTEGVAITHTRTNKNHDGIDTFEITPKTIFYSFAITNKHLKYRDDEFYRRFVILHTDVSKEQNSKVAVHYAQADFSSSDLSDTPKRILQHHLKNCLSSKTVVKNPFLEGILESFPREIKGHVRFRTAVKYLQALTKGKTLYEQSTTQSSPLLFSSITEVVQTLSLYKHTLVMNLHGINALEAGLLQVLEKNSEGISLNTLQEHFHDEYSSTLSCTDLIDTLFSRELVRKDADKIFSVPFPKISFSPTDLLEKASALMKKEYPKEHDSWYELCLNKIDLLGDETQ